MQIFSFASFASLREINKMKFHRRCQEGEGLNTDTSFETGKANRRMPNTECRMKESYLFIKKTEQSETTLRNSAVLRFCGSRLYITPEL